MHIAIVALLVLVGIVAVLAYVYIKKLLRYTKELEQTVVTNRGYYEEIHNLLSGRLPDGFKCETAEEALDKIIEVEVAAAYKAANEAQRLAQIEYWKRLKKAEVAPQLEATNAS